MNTRPLGTRGPMVGEVGLGTIKLGRTEGLKYPTPVELPSDERVGELLAAARELGVNLIDTAPAYGVAEQRLGKLLPGPREDWIISTKVGERFEDGASSFDFSADAVAASIDESLRNLKTDYVDVLLAHSDGRIEHDLVASGLLDALRRVQESGKALQIGVSAKTLGGALLAADHCDVVMLTLNPLDTECEGAVERARERGVGVLVKKALASGHVDKLAAPAGGSPANAAIRFVLNHAGVSSVVIGTASPEHLAQAVRVAEGRPSPDIVTPTREGAGRAKPQRSDTT